MFELTIVIGLLGALGYYIWKYRAVQKVMAGLTISDEEIQKTLVSGLYHRFKKPEKNENGGKAEIKEDPFDFEDFVAKIVEDLHGGIAIVTARSGDGGVDIRHKRADGIYLGQVKCYKDNCPFDPIAIIHSQIIKQGAAGGFVVTTSEFTTAAKQYAVALNADIELIDGKALVTYWAQVAEEKRQRKFQKPKLPAW